MAKRIVNIFIGSIGAKFSEWQEALALQKSLEQDKIDIAEAIDGVETEDGKIPGAADAVEAALQALTDAKVADTIASENLIEKLTLIKEYSLYKQTFNATDPVWGPIRSYVGHCLEFVKEMPDSFEQNYLNDRAAYYDFVAGLTDTSEMTPEQIDAKAAELKEAYIQSRNTYEDAKSEYVTYINALVVTLSKAGAKDGIAFPEENYKHVDDPNVAHSYLGWVLEDLRENEKYSTSLLYTTKEDGIKLADLLAANDLYNRGINNVDNAIEIDRAAKVNLQNAQTLQADIESQLTLAQMNAQTLESQFRVACPSYFKNVNLSVNSDKIGAIKSETARIMSVVTGINAETRDIIYDVNQNKSTSILEASAYAVSLLDKIDSHKQILENIQTVIENTVLDQYTADEKAELTERANANMTALNTLAAEIEKLGNSTELVVAPDVYIATLEIKKDELNTLIDETNEIIKKYCEYTNDEIYLSYMDSNYSYADYGAKYSIGQSI